MRKKNMKDLLATRRAEIKELYDLLDYALFNIHELQETNGDGYSIADLGMAKMRGKLLGIDIIKASGNTMST